MAIAETIVNGLIQGSLYALFAASFTIIFGVMDIPNMTHGVMFATGAYIFYYVFEVMGLPWYIGVVGGIVSVAVMGVVIERVFLDQLYEREESEYVFGVILVTFGLALIGEQFIGQFFGHDNYLIEIPVLLNTSYDVFGATVNLAQLAIVVYGAVCFLFLYWFTNHTLMGHSLRAIEQDRELAYMKGVNVEWVYLFTFVLGAVMISIAGILYGTLFSLSPGMGFNLLIKSFIIVILGGIGRIYGAAVAGYGLGLYEAFAISFIDSYFIFASEFLALIIFVLIKALLTKDDLPGPLRPIVRAIGGN